MSVGRALWKTFIGLAALIGAFVLILKFSQAVDWYWWQEGAVTALFGIVAGNHIVSYLKEA